MTREQELLQVANNYSEKLGTLKKHPPFDKRYSNESRDRIATSMRNYYKQVSDILTEDKADNS
jgi:major membrane immunogen (membrane-anchored lipoprotein)